MAESAELEMIEREPDTTLSRMSTGDGFVSNEEEADTAALPHQF
jgi:hypothetical protein